MMNAEKISVRSIGLLRIFFLSCEGNLILLRGQITKNPSQRLGCQSVFAIVCVYFFCFFDRVSPILKASALPSCPLLYSLPRRNLVIPIKNKLKQSRLFTFSFTPNIIRKNFIFILFFLTILNIIFVVFFWRFFGFTFIKLSKSCPWICVITHNLLLVEMGGIEPPSRTLF